MSGFKQRLQWLIDIKKYSQREVSEALGVNEARISEWLSGKVGSPRRISLIKLAELFGCDVDWLATGDDEPFPGVVQRARIAAKDLAREGIPVVQALAEQNTRCGDQPAHEATKDRKESINENEAVEQTIYVLRSNTVYSGALLSNIRAFHQGVKREEEMAGVDDRMAEMQNTMDMMMQMLESLGAVVPGKKGDTGSDQ